MLILVVAAVVFLAVHFLVSGTPLRDSIVAAIGEPSYLGLFSLASLASIVWLIVAYNHAQASGPDPLLYSLGAGVRHMGLPVILLAFLIGVPGLLTPNPTSVLQEGTAAKEETVRGILRVTRHPFLWAS